MIMLHTRVEFTVEMSGPCLCVDVRDVMPAHRLLGYVRFVIRSHIRGWGPGGGGAHQMFVFLDWSV